MGERGENEERECVSVVARVFMWEQKKVRRQGGYIPCGTPNP